jgi:hypothetical protein
MLLLVVGFVLVVRIVNARAVVNAVQVELALVVIKLNSSSIFLFFHPFFTLG